MPQNPQQVTCSNLYTPGRACAGPTAVVLHEWKSGIENLDHEMCRCLRPRPLTSPGCHTSYHFAIGGNCNFRQYVPLADTAWGFYFVPSPLCPIPPCPVLQLCDGIGADQYNPQESGVLPTPIVAAGPDLTANCSVIHVAIVTGAAQTGSGLFCIGSPNFSEYAYRCLVESLCYIYKTAALVPNGYANLLTHIGELMDLNLDQLAIDIQACIDLVPAPLPPCDCATPISPVIDNMISSQLGGLYSNFTVTDTPTIDLVKTGNALSANVKVSPNVNNQITAVANGLFVSYSNQLMPVIDYSSCSTLVPFIPGQLTKLTGFVQGSLGNFNIITIPNSTTQLSNTVLVFPENAVLNKSGWLGVIDYTTCKLIYLRDNKNNEITNTDNINRFPWFPVNSNRVTDNYVDNGSTLDIGGNSFSGFFKGNHIKNTSYVEISGLAVSRNVLNINSNTLYDSTLIVDVDVNTQLSIQNNQLNKGVISTNSITNNINGAFINSNTISDFGAINFGNLGNIRIDFNIIQGGRIDSILPPANITHNIMYNLVSKNGVINTIDSLANTYVEQNSVECTLDLTVQGGTVTINNNLFGKSSRLKLLFSSIRVISITKSIFYGQVEISANGGVGNEVNITDIVIMSAGQSNNNFDFRYKTEAANVSIHTIKNLTQLAGAKSNFNANLGNGSVIDVTIGPGGLIVSSIGTNSPQLSKVYVENGTLDYAGFTATNVHLEGASTVLVANVTNAKKSGYVNALP